MNKISKMLREVIEKKEKSSIRRVAREIGIDHGSLYRAFREGGNPEANTILKILDHYGYDLIFNKRKEARSLMKGFKISCPHCKEKVEIVQVTKEITKCPKCNKPLARKGRLLSGG